MAMDDLLFRYTLWGDPRTKKNSGRIRKRKNGARFVAPSEAFEAYEAKCLLQLRHALMLPILSRCNLQCVYYMATRRKVDLCNLLSATCDILVAADIIDDDNSGIVASHDGSRVLYDKDNPRVEIEIRRVT